MVICSPIQVWKMNWWNLMEEKDHFQLQEHRFWDSYRIVMISCGLWYVVANANGKEEILRDWKVIIDGHKEESKRVGSHIWSENHTKFYFDSLSNSDKSNGSENKIESEDSNSSSIEETFVGVVSSMMDNAVSIVIKSFEPNLVHHRTREGFTLLQILALYPGRQNKEEILELAKALIDRGAKVNAKDNKGWSTLHCACYTGQLSFVQLLMEKSANVLALSDDGSIGMTYLARNDFTEDAIKTNLQIKLMCDMIEKGVSVNSQNNEGDSILHQSVVWGGLKVVEFLIDKGALPNLSNNLGKTPLHLATLEKRVEMIRLLLEKGANPTLSDVNGESPIVVAFKSNLEEIHALMIEISSNFINSTPSSPKTEEESNREEKQSRSRVNSMTSSPQTSPHLSSSGRSNGSSPTNHHKVLPHSFKLSNYKWPTWCSVCNMVMFGLRKQGYCCEYCLASVHPVCKKEALLHSSCPRKLEKLQAKHIDTQIKGEEKEVAEEKEENNAEEGEREEDSTKEEGEGNINLEKELKSPVPSTVAEAFASWLSPDDLDLLYKQFNSMDALQTGEISEKEFSQGLGYMLNDSNMSRTLFKVLDRESKGKIDFADYAYGLSLLMRGTVRSQLEFAFELFSPDESGNVSRENFHAMISSIDDSLGSIQIDVEGFVSNTFDKIEGAKERRFITRKEYEEMALEDPLYISSLGLVGNKDISDFSTLRSPLIGPRREASISFGNEYWDLSYSVFLGIRLAVAEAASEQILKPKVTLEPKDFQLQVPYHLGSVCKSTEEWHFTDYAPAAFHMIREAFNIEPQHYMFSLGPEKIFGNLLMGCLGSLCQMVTTGRSGSFFFRTNDGKYLIKTVSYYEHNFLQQILPSYYEHVKSNGNSLLTRFCGLHSTRRGNEREVYFVIMCNLFDSFFQVHEQYDLKGSTIGRSVDSEGLDLSQVALKDNDFAANKRRINLGIEKRAILLEQIEMDVKWLESHGICDYSFLIGYHFLTNSEEEDFGLRRSTSVSSPTSQRRLSTTLKPKSIFAESLGGILSKDKKEIYFVGLIDILTTFDYKKMTEHFAKSWIYPVDQISAIRAPEYRARFQKYISSIID
eukprot:TRINITY_DN6491_c0_g1_i1.p1 TRINITY_DN6491_c0_g1~~TRINITY_DN6491_c0_g1_i1.p1  ORF type:complete len:1091 (+),score=342.66 TRINITY_DN6491_c0_g1_i1:185-3457(+)